MSSCRPLSPRGRVSGGARRRNTTLPGTAGVVHWRPVSAEVLLQGIVSGVLMGFLYALIAAGLSLIFGLMEIVNFAHGEFLMLAMFATFWAWALWRLDPLLSLPLTVALLFLVGVATYLGIIRWILGAPMLAQVFATFGLAVFLRSA